MPFAQVRFVLLNDRLTLARLLADEDVDRVRDGSETRPYGIIQPSWVFYLSFFFISDSIMNKFASGLLFKLYIYRKTNLDQQLRYKILRFRLQTQPRLKVELTLDATAYLG